MSWLDSDPDLAESVVSQHTEFGSVISWLLRIHGYWPDSGLWITVLATSDLDQDAGLKFKRENTYKYIYSRITESWRIDESAMHTVLEL